MTTPLGQHPVAIVGMAVLLPGARDLEAYWRNLVDGIDAITDVPANRWDPAFFDPDADPARADRVYCRRGGFVDGPVELDPARFGIMPSSVPGTEPDQLIALQVAAAAVADAGGRQRLPAPEQVGVVLGRGGYLTPGLVRLDQRVRTANQLVHTLRELLPALGEGELERIREAFAARLGRNQPESAIGLVPNLAASRIANRLDLRGPAYTVDAACASSLIAVDHAVTELAMGRCDAVIAGGVHHCHDITLWSVFGQLKALSRAGRSRPFDRAADGILIGEGTGAVVLKRLADAERDGDRIYAVIRGTGVAGDGRGASLFNPEPAGQAQAVRRAWQAAGLDPTDPGSIGLLEAHGTGTPVGDAAELTTLAEVFGPGRGPAPVIGSVKSMIGHAMPAAGVASLVKAALAVHRGVLPPTLHCDDPRPELLRTRFRPIATAQPWESDGPRRAGVNAFGFGGINAHVVLEQAPGHDRPHVLGHGRLDDRATARTRSASVTESELVLRVAAPDRAALADLLAGDDAALRAGGTRPASDAACRLAVVGPTAKRLALARRVVAEAGAWRGRGDVWFSPAPLLLAGGRIGFVFPGLEADFTPRVVDVAAHFGRSLGRYAAGEPGATDVGRHGAGVVTVGRLLDDVLRRIGIVPDAVAGHSVGEWTAMAAAGLYAGTAVEEFLDTFDPDSIQVPGLVFAVVGAGVDRVAAAVTDRSGIVVSHDNAPNQTIVCGPEEAVTELVRWFRRQNVLCQVLPFRSGFHTPMLAPYLGPIQAAADRFELRAPTVPVWSATTAAPYPTDPAEIRRLFVRHLLEPVRFRPMVEAMHDAGVRVFVQVGTGQLASLIGDILRDREFLAVPANVPQHDGMAQLRRVAAALWVEGGRPDDRLLRPPGGSGAARDPGRAVALDLGGALLSLGDEARRLMPRELGVGPVVGPEVSLLDGLAERHPMAGELAGLLRETAQAAAAVFHATRPAGPRPTRAEPPPAVARPIPAGPAGPIPAGPAGPIPAGPTADRPADRTTVLRVSAQDMPYLYDHCFFRQRPGWPDDTDRWPVVPATTVAEHMMSAAERSAPGLRPIAVHGARFDRWVVAAPPVDVPVTVAFADDRRARVAFGPYAQAVVELAEGYPRDAPAPRRPPAGERPAPHTADQIYRERWMFHGPRFQGLTELSGTSEGHVRGVLTTPPAPGALLDNVGQLLGYWIMATQPSRTTVFPVGMSRIRFFGPHPAPGAPVDCTIWIRALTDGELTADAELVHDGRVWALIDGWVDRRFDNHPDTQPMERFPEHHTLSRRQPGDWTLVYERWPDLASRDLIMRNHLGAAERAAYERCSPRARRQWLLGRIAVKDAVRFRQWDGGEEAVFPAEIGVGNDEAGRPGITGVHGRVVEPVDVSLAHCAEVGVAIARPRPADGRPAAIGIDVEEITERSPATHRVALSTAESELMAAACARTGEPERLWFTRFWTAKEAVAKAEGTGLGGRPQRFAVVSADPTALTVSVAPDGTPGPAHIYQVRCARISNPDGLPARDYVVAWTADDTQEATA